jgi:hypothetical protein
MFYIHRFRHLHRSMRSVSFIYTLPDDVTMRPWHNVMMLRRPTTERGHCRHAFVVHEVISGDVRCACVQWFRGAEETGQKGLALTGVHRCVWILYTCEIYWK